MTYANGADGSCADCGEDTAESWHLYCPDCFAEQQGWRRPGRDGHDGVTVARTSYLRMQPL